MIILARLDDIFAWDKVVKVLTDIISSSVPSIRTFFKSLNVNSLRTGFEYEILNHKSIGHKRLENSSSIIENMNLLSNYNNAPLTSFYGIFDGHGGSSIAEYLSFHMGPLIGKQSFFENNLCDAMRKAYIELDDMVLKKIRREVNIYH